MINVNLLEKCSCCEKLVEIGDLYIDNFSSEETHLVREYYCECGRETVYKEVVNYIADLK